MKLKQASEVTSHYVFRKINCKNYSLNQIEFVNGGTGMWEQDQII